MIGQTGQGFNKYLISLLLPTFVSQPGFPSLDHYIAIYRSVISCVFAFRSGANHSKMTGCPS